MRIVKTFFRIFKICREKSGYARQRYEFLRNSRYIPPGCDMPLARYVCGHGWKNISPVILVRSTHHCRRQHHLRSIHHLPVRANIIQSALPIDNPSVAPRQRLACRLGRCFCLRQRCPPDTRTLSGEPNIAPAAPDYNAGGSPLAARSAISLGASRI